MPRIVPTAGEFGRLGAMPSNPQLLDWLASEFIAQGFSLKELHRLILSSTVWRQRTVPQSANTYARSLRRLGAETIRDRVLPTGSLDKTLYGKPLKIKEDETGPFVVDGPQTRGSLYIQVRRSRPVALMRAFDAPVMETNCESRPSSTVATQSLMLLNGNFFLDQAAELADRAAREAATLEMSELKSLPKIAEVQQRSSSEGPYYFACKIGAEIQSAKKFAWGADLTVRIDQNADDAAVVITRLKRKLDEADGA